MHAHNMLVSFRPVSSGQSKVGDVALEGEAGMWGVGREAKRLGFVGWSNSNGDHSISAMKRLEEVAALRAMALM